MSKEYEREDIQFLNDILTRNYYNTFKTTKEKTIEFVLNHTCYNNCSYCYLSSLNNIYPKNNNSNQELLNNFSAFINWYIENNFIADIELVGNQWLYDLKNSSQIFDILYTSYNNTKFKPKNIIIRSDMKFINQNEIILMIEKYLQDFNNIDINIKIIGYLNGKFCDNNIYTDEEYEKIFNFIKNNKGEIQTTITPFNVNYWIENFKWWVSNFKTQDVLKLVHITEETSDKWEGINLINLISFLDFQSDYFIEHYDKDFLLKLIFNNQQKINFTNCSLKNNQILSNIQQFRNCNFHNSLTIDVLNANIITCPKINYEDFVIGHFNIENNKVIQCIPQNIELIILNTHLKRSSTPHCETCMYIDFCDGFCYGKSFDISYNIIIPILENCKMIYGKINFLIYKYYVLNYLTKNNLIENSSDEIYNKQLINIINNIKKEV